MTGDYIDLTPLYPLQAGLDEEIALEHHVTYESTFSRRVLALLTELGEFANETRCFKYWSNKGPSPKEKILDEYVDGLHFFLSLGIPLGVSEYRHYFKVGEKDLTKAILIVHEKVAAMHEDYDVHTYAAAFGAYLNIIPLFDYGEDEVIEAYLKKLRVNHNRQKEGY